MKGYHTSLAAAVTQYRAAEAPQDLGPIGYCSSPAGCWPTDGLPALNVNRDQQDGLLAAALDAAANRDLTPCVGSTPVVKSAKRTFPPNSRDPRRFYQGYRPSVYTPPGYPVPPCAGAQAMADRGTPAALRQLPEWGDAAGAAQPADCRQSAAGAAAEARAQAGPPGGRAGAEPTSAESAAPRAPAPRWTWLSLGGKAPAAPPAPAAGSRKRTVTIREFVAMAAEQDPPPVLPTVVPKSFRRNHERARAALKWAAATSPQQLAAAAAAELGAPAEQPPAKRRVSRDPRRRVSPAGEQ